MKAVCQSLEALHYGCSVFSTLPRGPVEPAFIALQQSQNQDSWTLGPLFAPCGVRADNILVRGLSQYARPGRPLQFELVLNAEYPSRTHAELNIAAASVAFHTHVSVSLVLLVSLVSQVHGADGADEATVQLLQAAVVPTQTETGIGSVVSVVSVVSVTINIPEGTPRDAEVVIHSVTFAGQAVSRCLTGCGAEVQTLPFHMPVRLRVVTGMHAPLQLKQCFDATAFRSTPVITSDGTLYAPKRGSPDVLVFAADGTPLPPLPLAALGLSTENRCNAAAFVHAFVEDTGTLLLLADIKGGGTITPKHTSKLVAVDAASRAVRWSTVLGSECLDIAVLPAQGVVVASDWRSRKLYVLRLSDGTYTASVAVREPSFIAADPVYATLYVSTFFDEYNDFCGVTTFRWDGAAMVFDGVVEAAGSTYNYGPLAVVPPASGQHSSGQCTSYLVVGTLNSPSLRVLSLPDRRLVYTHTLEGMKVTGLAADPSGTALAVCDKASKSIHVLPWPLPGMELAVPCSYAL